MYKEVLFMKLKDLLLVADCNYHVFFKSEIANISGLPYEEIQKEQLKDYLDMTVLRVDQEWNITIG
jgi:metallophosphoesterase superfamily enzyme